MAKASAYEGEKEGAKKRDGGIDDGRMSERGFCRPTQGIVRGVAREHGHV